MSEGTELTEDEMSDDEIIADVLDGGDGGGNLDTDVIASRMIKEMFNFRNFGRGSAIAVILLLAVIPVMVTNIRRFQQQEANR